LDSTPRFLILFTLGAVAITAAAMIHGWWMEPARRSRRVLAARLGGGLDAIALASHRGEGIALRISPPGIAVLRGPGDRGLAFGFEELLGVELMVNGEVRARVFRGESRRPLDVTRMTLEHLALRLVFDDLRYPEFELRLLEPDDAVEGSSQVLDGARRMFAHLEAILRQPRTEPAPAAVTASPAPPPGPAAPHPAAPEDAEAADDPPF
jgi:hypothetical protein